MNSNVSEATRQQACAIYQQHKDLIDSDAVHGSEWDMRVARTTMSLEGVSPESFGIKDEGAEYVPV
ncbi:hypothetical protein [Methanococcoides seepicolus]|jgi:hypothetical protein|uniref:Uncharacterized protein n=1 Tax=Methanococcoides seepicolus TaxID=2828780 RepID=A0A9E5DCB0_9EURY|nr:hypothetical protein [Methanococcoides seepicolus]MCM1986934.1 hypothetical protein [Methanococcoides seepicolus]